MEELKILLQKILNKESAADHPEQQPSSGTDPEGKDPPGADPGGTVVPGDCLQRNSGVSREFYSRTADGPDLHRLTGAVPAGRILSEDPAGHRSGQQKGQADTER